MEFQNGIDFKEAHKAREVINKLELWSKNGLICYCASGRAVPADIV